uniref:NON-INTRINSIC ABC protein 6 n=1 Tax=Rhizophora mucronata TaxID=61149 RepID=A0A2P2Q424_RHIMU
MSALAVTPQIHTPSSINPRLKPKPMSKIKTRCSLATTSMSPQAGFSDPFVLQLAETLEDSLSSSPSLQKLRDSSSQSLLSTSWPSRKVEPFRFTDTSFIKQLQIHPVSKPPSPPRLDHLTSSSADAHTPNLVMVDGFVLDSASNLSNLTDGVYVGSLPSDPQDGISKRVSEFLGDFQWGDLFWSINGLGAPDMTVVYVPAGIRVHNPIHFRYISIEGEEEESKKLPLSNPRVFVLVEEGGEIGIIEEFVSKEGNDNKYYWANSVLEMVIGEGAKVRHSYVQSQSLNSAHIKWTSVRQESASTYELVEVSTGGRLSRHNLHVQQFGPDTVTELSTFNLCVNNQTQDLHSRLILDHPRAYSRQLHKCIVAHSLGQAVFDGNIKVNRYAQQTDAEQLTRSLLLEPRATVNVKPNLQIIADDVKCSHGAAISDLEESQLFYFKARGVDLETARKALVLSFGGEVIQRLPQSLIRKEVESHVKGLLDSTKQG